MTEESIKPARKPNKVTMIVTPYTKSFKVLLPYIALYTLGYTLLPIILVLINFPLGGLFLSAFVVLIVGAVLISVFKMTQKRFLEKIECSRIGVVGALITILISAVIFANSLNEILPDDITLNILSEQGIIKMIFIQFVVMLFIHYAVICYSLWFMQKPWQRKI